MNSKKTGLVSGCVVWGLSACILLSCFLPVFTIAGSVTSFSQLAIQTTGNIICPDETRPDSYSYQTTTTDEFGNTQPATAYELHCIDQNGEVVKEDPVAYSFLWIGGFAFVGLILAGILAFALAAPAGVLIGRLLHRTQKPNFAATIEPE
jgi:hypothetical protein